MLWLLLLIIDILIISNLLRWGHGYHIFEFFFNFQIMMIVIDIFVILNFFIKFLVTTNTIFWMMYMITTIRILYSISIIVVVRDISNWNGCKLSLILISGRASQSRNWKQFRNGTPIVEKLVIKNIIQWWSWSWICYQNLSYQIFSMLWNLNVFRKGICIHSYSFIGCFYIICFKRWLSFLNSKQKKLYFFFKI